jgi:hypothetical protein
MAASALIMTFADLGRERQSAFGAYVSRSMTRTMEAVRLAGDIILAVGAWFHSVALMIAGVAIILAAWLSGLARKDLHVAR